MCSWVGKTGVGLGMAALGKQRRAFSLGGKEKRDAPGTTKTSLLHMLLQVPSCRGPRGISFKAICNLIHLPSIHSTSLMHHLVHAWSRLGAKDDVDMTYRSGAFMLKNGTKYYDNSKR